jgi:hypothetical protein
MHNGTAVLTSINNVKSGMAINAEPNPEMPWMIPDKKKMNDIRIKVIMSTLIIKLLLLIRMVISQQVYRILEI